MATKTWIGSVVNNNWTTAANWFPSAPATGDDVIFDGVAPLGNNNCTYNVGVAISLLSINFTGYTGQFTFSNGITVTGNITLGAGASYVTSATPTTYTLITGAASILTFNGKSLPVNYSPAGSGTQTFVGNADFQGNYSGQATGYNIKAAATTTIDLRIGGNLSFGSCTTNPTEYVTIKLYGTSKTIAANTITNNQRVVFVSGSSYTNAGNVGSGGTSFYTVESGGRFNTLNPNTTTFTVGTVSNITLSGFNSTTSIIGSDFMSIIGSGVYNILNDTLIKGSIQISSNTLTINSPTGGKILLEGNFTGNTGATTIIDKLEFSGTTVSNITVVSSGNNLQVKEFIINKTGAGIVNFNSNGIFSLFVATGATNFFTYTNGIVTQNSSCIIRFAGNNPAATTTYSATTLPSTAFRSIEVAGGTLNLNSELKVATLSITPNTNPSTTITSSALFGFVVEELIMINSSGAGRTITLKSNVVYSVISLYFAFTTNPLAPITLNASTPGTKAKLYVEPGGLPNVSYVNAVNIDSSGTNGVLPFTKVPIYTFGGTVTTTFNWNTGNQPPPLTPSRTVAYTFVN